MIGAKIAVPNLLPWLGGGPSFTGLLDAYPGAAAAYSVRRLSGSYSGSAIRVRESSGDTETDIGFVGQNLDETALLAHCGANDGFVVKWYDQSGNGYDAVQATAGSQPKIVSAGSVIKENGLPALDFDGANDVLSISQSVYSSDINLFLVTKILTTTSTNTGYYQRIIHLADGTNSYQVTRSADINSYVLLTKNTEYQLSTDSVSWGAHSGQILISARSINTSDSDTLYVDSVEQNAGASVPLGGGNNSPSTIGARNDLLATSFFEGAHQELIIYNSDKSSLRTAIEGNINDYYSIYP